MISWEDFEKVDICTGTIVEVNGFPKARKPSWQIKIDFGPVLGIKNSSAQITHHYSKQDLVGRQILAVVNLPPKQIANFFSECLVLGVADESGEIVLLSTDQRVDNGESVK
ncbi:MAG: tRNA-binding protein [Vicingaceae bacterium]|jgi:tRNA-binding protein